LIVSKKSRKLFKIQLNETIWTYRCLSEKKYKELYGNDSEAIALLDEHKLIFQDQYLSFKRILHEVCHAYVEDLSLSSAVHELNFYAIEEIFAVFLEKKWKPLLEKSLQILCNLDNDQYTESGLMKLHQTLLDLPNGGESIQRDK